MQEESNEKIFPPANQEHLSNITSLMRSDGSNISTTSSHLNLQRNSSPSVVYVSPPDLTPILEHFQKQQFAIFHGIAKQQNRALGWMIAGILFFLLLAAAIGFAVFHFYFRPVEQVRKSMASDLADYQQQLQNKFKVQLQEMQQTYEHNVGQLSQEGRAGYEQLFGFAQKVQQDYAQELTLEQKRSSQLLHRQEILEQTVKELTISLTKSEATVVQTTSENQQLQDKLKALQTTVEKQKEEIRLLRKQLAERLSPAELEKLRKELQDDD